MNKMALGALAALMLAAVGVFWWQGRAIEAVGEAPPEASEPPPKPTADPEAIPSADVGEMRGPALPEAVEMSDEQRRFARYDRNNDGIISRNEMLSTRTGSFRKLDKDGNNLLTFEEWAVTTVDRFAKADGNGDGRLTPAEFATTRSPPRPAKPRCNC